MKNTISAIIPLSPDEIIEEMKERQMYQPEFSMFTNETGTGPGNKMNVSYCGSGKTVITRIEEDLLLMISAWDIMKELHERGYAVKLDIKGKNHE